jgi:FkbM family methyltransferase
MTSSSTATTPTLKRISYAQNMEDILLDRLFGDQIGTFIDVGANNPALDSNTYFFYERGWRGVNIEPLPGMHQLFLQFRPEDLNLAVAVSNEDGELPFYEVTPPTGLSTLSSELAAQYRAHGWEVVEKRIPVRTLGRLIEEYRLAPPDFLSIDVENHEGQVIQGIPLATWRPKVFVIESTLPMSTVSNHESWESLLTAHGYLFATFNGINRFYLREDMAPWLDRLRVPVNVLDIFETATTARLRREVAQLEQKFQQLQAMYRAEHAELEQARAALAQGVRT